MAPLPDIELPFTIKQAVVAYTDADTDPTNYTESGYDSTRFTTGRREWYALTEGEADEYSEASARSYLDDLLYSVPDALRWYFDEAKYIEDNASIDDALGDYEEVYTTSADFRRWLLDVVNELREFETPKRRPLKKLPIKRLVFDNGDRLDDSESFYIVSQC